MLQILTRLNAEFGDCMILKRVLYTKHPSATPATCSSALLTDTCVKHIHNTPSIYATDRRRKRLRMHAEGKRTF